MATDNPSIAAGQAIEAVFRAVSMAGTHARDSTLPRAGIEWPVQIKVVSGSLGVGSHERCKAAFTGSVTRTACRSAAGSNS
ncbi:hypothetical protein, partial [Nocardia sp. NPDC004711]